MKKLILLCCIFVLTACSISVSQENSDEIKVVRTGVSSSRGCYLIEITVHGETHEYIKYVAGNHGGISHWPGCKYCKKHEN